MVFGSATPGVSVRSGASRTRQSLGRLDEQLVRLLGRLDEQLVRLLGRPQWPGFVAAPFWRAWPAMLRRSERVSCSFRVDAPFDLVHSSASPDRTRAVCPDPHTPMLPLAPATPSSDAAAPTSPDSRLLISTGERPVNNDEQPRATTQLNLPEFRPYIGQERAVP